MIRSVLFPGQRGPVALLVTGSASWAVLFASLEIGRTTLLTVSRGWIVSALAGTAAMLIWMLLFGLALGRTSGLPSRQVVGRMSTCASPLLASIPLLMAIYGSDELFHFLSANPIPKALATWSPLLAVLVGQQAAVAWSFRLRETGQRRLRRPSSTPLLIFATFACLYIYTAGGHLYTPDESQMYFVTQNLAERGSIAIPRDGQIPPDESPVWYSKYGLVTSLLGMPGYWLSMFTGLEPDPPSASFPVPSGAYPLVSLLTNPLISAATCALLYVMARELGFKVMTSLILAAIFGLATSAWVYSKTFLSQPPAAMFVLGAAYLLLRKEGSPLRNHGLAGICLGLAIGTRAELALLAAPLALLPLGQLRSGGRDRVGLIIAFAVPLLLTAGITLAGYNYVKSGSVFMTGHGGQGTLAGFSTRPYVGLFGTLASPGFGFFLYNPAALLGMFSLPLLALRRPLEAYLFGGLITLSILFYGSFGDWFGGFTWGNRYLAVILAFALLPLGAALEGGWRNPAGFLIVAGAVLMGVLVNFTAALFDFNSGWLNLWDHRANLDLITWYPHYSPIVAHLRLLRDFLFTGAKLDLYIYFKLGFPSLLAFLLLFTNLATLTVRSALTSEQAAQAHLRPAILPPTTPGAAVDLYHPTEYNASR